MMSLTHIPGEKYGTEHIHENTCNNLYCKNNIFRVICFLEKSEMFLLQNKD